MTDPPTPPLAYCRHCSQPFTPPRCDAQFCCGGCRSAAYRVRRRDRAVTPPVVTPPVADRPLTLAAIIATNQARIDRLTLLIRQRPGDRTLKRLRDCGIALRDRARVLMQREKGGQS